jgi:pimeloyl-ACP methyl ester carboxylesterase
MIAYPTQIAGVATRLLESGNAGTPVVFVHGTGGRADRWSRNLDAVAAAGYRAYAFDLPGHGYAAKGPGVACSVSAYSALLKDFLESTVREKAWIVGTSLGGHVAASYAAENPSKVKGVVLVGSMGLLPIGAEARGRIQAGANNQSREGVATKFTRIIFDQALVTPEMVEEEFRVNNSPGAKESFAALGAYIAEKLDDEVVGEKLAATGLPVLLVWGDQDKTVPPAVGEAAAKLIPGSRFLLLAGAAHTAYYEKHEAFNKALLDFLRS